jgi:hypothetical protein
MCSTSFGECKRSVTVNILPFGIKNSVVSHTEVDVGDLVRNQAALSELPSRSFFPILLICDDTL